MSLFRNLLIEKKRRKYYVELEYLESTGTQYIDTGYKMSAGKTMTFNGNIMWTQSNGNANFFYGYRSVNSAEYRGDMRAFFVYGTSAPPAGRLAIRYGVNTDNSSSTISFNQRYNISFDGTNLNVDGTYFISISSYYTPAVYQNMYLFWCNCTEYYSADVAKFSGRIYNWQIFEDGVLVRDLIPVLDWDMTPCLYDRVTEQLFYNQGTGNFVAGRQIHPVEYLESTGTQYIDTGFKVDDTCGYDISWMALNADDRIIIGTKGSNDSRWVLSGGNNPQVNMSWNSVFTSDGLGLNKIQTAKMNYLNDRKRILNDTPLEDISTTLSPSASTYNVGIFAGCWSSGTFSLFSTCRIYYAKITKGSDVVRDYIPAISEDGTAFMFDRVSHACYLNQGTGSFKYPAREVEYLQSSGTQYINTGYIPNTNTYVEMNAMYTALDSTYRTPFSVRAYDGAANSFTIAGATNAANVYAFGSYYWSGDNGCPIAYTNVKYFMSLKAGVAIFNGVTGNAGTTITPTTLTAYMFARNANGTASNFFIGRIYDCQLKDNGTLVRDFIPCFKDGVACMVDKLTGTAYTNQGTGSFGVGKIIEPKFE